MGPIKVINKENNPINAIKDASINIRNKGIPINTFIKTYLTLELL